MKLHKKKSAEIDIIKKSIEKTENFENAFIHTSYRNENYLAENKSYELLEWFGDRILGVLSAEYIYSMRNSEGKIFSEGEMTKLQQRMVQESTLAEASVALEIDKYLKLGKGEKKNCGKNKSILADIFESFLAAVYLEKGIDSCKKILEYTIFDWSKGKENQIWDYKTTLQEFCQSNKYKIVYNNLGVSTNSSNDNFFTIEGCVEKSEEDVIRKRAKGKNKKEAEQKVAKEILKFVGVIKKREKKIIV